ncbi:MAG: hypothetical protein ABL876_07480 [Chitinophagaceae bacterium]
MKQFIKKYFGHWIYRRQVAAVRKNELENWVNQFQGKTGIKLADTSFNVFTYHGEDGILAYLISQLKDVPKTFVDIGSGDCIKSNCANLAVHFGWQGIFIDKDPKQLSVGKCFYKDKIKQGASIRFTEAEVTTGNVNQLITDAVYKNNVGLLSIDIDGNDYWIWKAIESIQPEVVLIEAKVEFGYKSLVVPYGQQNHHSADREYNGASVAAIKTWDGKRI